MHRNSRRLLATTGALLGCAIVLALAGCAPATQHPQGTPTILHSPGQGHRSSATPRPTKAAALAPPVVRVPLTCDQIAPVAAISAALGTTVTPASPWEVADLEPYAYVQDGTLSCDWSSTIAGDSSDYSVLVMPDITPARWAEETSDNAGVSNVSNPFGANSFATVEGSPNQLEDNLDMLIGNTWLSISDFSDQTTQTFTDAQVSARFQTLLHTAVTAVTGVTIKEPLWSDPAATPVTGIADSSAEDQRLATAMGLPFGVDVYEPDLEAVGPLSEALLPVNFYRRGGGAGDYAITLQMLPQGSWAWSKVVAAASGEPGYVALSGLGDKAVTYNLATPASPYDSVIEGIKDHSLYSIEVSTANAAEGPTILDTAKKVATAVLTEIG
jgi:hypothetical protein